MDDDEIRRIRREIFGKPGQVAQEQPEVTETNPDINPGLLRMFPPARLARIMKKELRRFKQAQEKKWRNWMKAVSK